MNGCNFSQFQESGNAPEAKERLKMRAIVAAVLNIFISLFWVQCYQHQRMYYFLKRLLYSLLILVKLV